MPSEAVVDILGDKDGGPDPRYPDMGTPSSSASDESGSDAGGEDDGIVILDPPARGAVPRRSRTMKGAGAAPARTGRANKAKGGKKLTNAGGDVRGEDDGDGGEGDGDGGIVVLDRPARGAVPVEGPGAAPAKRATSKKAMANQGKAKKATAKKAKAKPRMTKAQQESQLKQARVVDGKERTAMLKELSLRSTVAAKAERLASLTAMVVENAKGAAKKNGTPTTAEEIRNARNSDAMKV